MVRHPQMEGILSQKIDLKWTVLFQYSKVDGFKITLDNDMLSNNLKISVVNSGIDELIMDYLMQKLAKK